MWKRARYGALVATIPLMAAGCESATEPSPAPFDVNGALEDYDAMDSTFSDRDWAALEDLVDTGALASVLGSPAGVRAGGGPAGAPIISDFHRGHTFVYDPEDGRYLVDLGRDGAPGNGVRFVTYALDSAGDPIMDQETGYADLVDEGDASVEDIVLRMTLVEAGEVTLDHRTAVSHDAVAGAVGVDGFVSDGPVRLDFDVDVEGATSGAEEWGEIAFRLALEARDFEISGNVSGDRLDQSERGEVVVVARHGSDSFRVDIRGSDGIIDGVVDLNGEPFATVSGPSDSPTFSSADGDPLTVLEAIVLWRMVDGIEDAFDLVEDLLDPVGELVLLGVIL